jgi:renal tumor antigen
MRKYRLVAKKGEGTFSEVLKAQNVKDGKYHAIKCMKNRFESIDQVNNLREIQALRRLSPHEHVISLEEVLYDQPTGRLALVFELMEANLYELIRGRRHYLQPSLIKSYMWQLMKSLDHMHKKGIFHRDIKPENILIESATEVGRGLKLADFGSCRGIYSKQPYTEYISTRWYRAPECLLTDGYYGPEMDLWGAGCVMFEITSLYPLFPGSNEVDQINRIHKVLGTPSAEILNKFKAKGASHISFDFPAQKGIGIPSLIPHAAPEAVDLIVKLLKYDAAERITAREAMRHPYFKDIREAEAKQQAEASARQAAAPPAAAAVAAPAASVAAQPSSNTKPLPQLVPSDQSTVRSVADNSSVGHYQQQQQGQQHYLMAQKQQGQQSNAGYMAAVQQQQLHLQQQQLHLQQQQQLKGNSMVGGGTNTNTQIGSSLPPIGMTANKFGSSAASNNIDPKTGRTILGMGAANTAMSNNNANNSSTQPKRRKKYRIGLAAQQRSVQNSDSMMKAYGVASTNGVSGGGSKYGADQSSMAGGGGGGGYVHYNGSKVNTGANNMNMMGGGYGANTGASSYGGYQSKNGGGGGGNRKY